MNSSSHWCGDLFEQPDVVGEEHLEKWRQVPMARVQGWLQNQTPPELHGRPGSDKSSEPDPTIVPMEGERAQGGNIAH